MKKKVLPVLLSLVFLFSSCNITTNTNKNNIISIANTMNFLTSDKCAGRLSGTQGNKEAEKYIEECFNKIGLEKYEGSYLDEYSQRYWKTSKESYKMSIKFSNGDLLECKYGEDFIENYLTNMDMEAPLTFNSNDKNLKDCILAVEQGKNYKNSSVTPKAILTETKDFIITPPTYIKGTTPRVQISPKLSELLKRKSNANIHIKFECDPVEETISQNNVVGLINGENSKNAIILSAHFDHSGSRQNNILRGAIDNASGTSVLIDIAQKVQQYSKKVKPKQDILFCAFNGEESNLQGSEAFINTLTNKYTNIYNINIDCVGLKGDDELGIYSDYEGCTNLVNDIEKQLKEDGISTKLTQELSRSDHCSFIENNICAVSLMQGVEVSDHRVIHTLKDNLLVVDFKYLEKLSKSISNYLIDHGDKVYKIENKDDESSSIQPMTEEEKIIMDEEGKLKFNQYKLIKLGNTIRVIDKNSDMFLNNEDFAKLYPNLIVPKTVDDMDLSYIDVRDHSKEHIVNSSYDINISKEQIARHQIGKIYTIKSLYKNIENLQIGYQKKENKNVTEDISIIVYVFDKGNKLQMKTSSSLVSGSVEKNTKCMISKDKLDIGGLKYQTLYDKASNDVKGLYLMKEDKNKKCHIIIHSYKANWPYKTKEEAKNIMEHWKLNGLIKDILKGFFN